MVFFQYFGPLLQLKQGLRTCCYHSSESTIAKTFITMCDVFFTTLSHISLQDLEKWIVLCIAWSFGASLDFQDRKLIDQCIRDIDSHLLPPRSLFDYHINPKTNEYELWETKISIGPFSVFQEIVIPTESHARYSYILDQSIKMGHRSLVVGNSGCGKSSLVNAVLGRTEVWSNMTINLSPSLASSELQYTITEKLEKKSKDKLAPINGADKLLIFIDDLNLPRESSSESPFKPSLEFIQHFLSYGGWYHKKTCAWQSVIDTAMICAMTTPAGGRSMIPDRLQSRFNVINHADLSEQELVSVFQSVLTHKFKSCPSEIKSVLDLISKATIDIYKQSYQAFLPVPGKCFYGFTLHDVFRVAQGMFLIDSNDIETKESLQFLWVHECQRSFSDRFVNDEDQKTFLNILFNALEHYMHSESISYQCVKHEDSFALPNFAPNLEVEKTNAISLNRYNQIHDKERFCEALQKNLNDYNINKVTYKANMNLVLFDDAIGHICRISRVLHMHRGNMLFIGVGGSGRESLTRLSAFIFNFNVFTMRGSRKHKKDDFREDLKSFCMQCGVKNKQSIFFLKDKHVKHEIVLEDINQLMISGDVPRLYGKEEKALICKEVKKDALYEGVKDSEQSLWNFFIQRSMKNMHFVIALNPLGKNFSARIYEYPCLLRCSTINYFNKWPEEALEKVAYTHLSQFDYVRESASPISKIFAGIHDEAHLRSVDMKRTNKRCNHLTPRHFLELAFEFERCLEKKKDELFHHQKKLSGGLTKLEDGRTHVEILKQDLEEKQKIVGKSQTDCEVMLETIVSEKQRAEKKRGEMIKDSIRIEKEEQHQSIIASEAEADLAIALPALQSALEQVEKLEKSSITEIKAYSSPPVAVERVLSCVMILFGKETHWASAKRYLGDTNFLFHLKTFDKDNVKETTIAKITKYIKSPSFGADEVYKVSKAAGALCVWCHAIYQYAGVTKHVAPKRIKLKKAQEGLQIKQHDMKKTEEELDTATKELQALRREYERSVEKKNELSSEALSLANKLDKAEKLIGGLSGEYSRWNKTIGEIEKHLETIIGEAILSAAFLSYAGPFDLTHRSILINEWKRISFDRGFGVSSDFRPAHLLSTSSERRNWNLNGLPKDSFSTENAVIISNTTRWPLLIDPQGQGASWITAMEGNDLTIIDVKSTSLLHDIEVALTLGLPTMVVNVKEELDSALDNLLSKTFKKQDRDRREVNLGGKVINYNERFHLYLISSLAFPNFATEISSITNIVDFTVTEVGLEEQLLSLVVNEENSDLAKEKSIIVLKLANDKQKLREIEDNILALLSESSGNFIDDELLLNALQRSKQTARDIEKQVVADKKTEERIDIARESYRLAARRSSLIFLTLQDLSTVGCMYQYSLDWYMELFRQNIRSCKKPNNYDEPDRRVETINQHHTLNIYQLTSTGLFQKDKVLFAFQLCIRIMQNMGLIKPSEVDFFCDGKFMTSGDVQKKILNIQWLDKTVLDSLPYLDNIIDGFVTHIKVNEEHWRQWHRSEKPEEMPLPDKLDSKLSIIQKLCVLRTMRKDRVPFAVTKLVSKVLGHQFSNEPQLNLAEVVKVSSSTTPIVIILSSGIDSTDQISSLASFSSTAFNHIALGQGQSHAAHHAINIAKSTGGWVLLANCHLMPDWMDSLELIVDKHSNELIHENFRLWLSSKPTPYFPLSVLQRALKITTEPPTGLVSIYKIMIALH
jgi:dynein heavy chain